MEKAKGKRRLGGKDGGICPRRRPPFGAPSPQQRKMGAGEIQIPHGEPVEPRDLDFAFSSVDTPPTSSFDRLILRQAQDEVGGEGCGASIAILRPRDRLTTQDEVGGAANRPVTLVPGKWLENARGGFRPGPQPRRAASIAATSILPISIIASKARLASAPPAAIASISARGVICQEMPHLSLHQPHTLSSPPL